MKIKINGFILIIAFLLSALITFGFYAFWSKETILSSKHISVLISAFIITFCSIGTFGFSISSGRVMSLIRTIATIFLIIGLVSIIALIYFSSTPAPIVIAMGIEFLIYLLVIYSLTQSGQ